jgi:CHRD domain
MRSIILCGSMILMLAGCGSDRGMTYPVGNATISLSVSSADPMASAGDSRSVTAVVRDGNGAVLPEATVSWRSSAPGVATVSAFGATANVVAVDDGTAVITAKSEGIESAVTIAVHREPVSIELLSPVNEILEGFTAQLVVVGRDARQSPIHNFPNVTFRSSNAFSVLVSPSGMATALFSAQGPFNSTITATVPAAAQTLTATTKLSVLSAAPAEFDSFGYMIPGEIPANPLTAGTGMIYLTYEADRIRYQIQWALLNAPPTGAHFHGPSRPDGEATDVLVSVPVGNQPERQGTLVGSITAADIQSQGGRPPISLDSLVTLFRSSQAYFDMHTDVYPDGEIRSSIFPRVIPSPTVSARSDR